MAATVLAAGFFGVAPQAQGIVENSGDVSVRPTTGEEAIASAPADTGNDASVRDAVYLSERSPVVDGVGGLTEDEVREAQDIARRTVETPAESTYVPGEMWSDTVGLPQGVEKGAADEAEVAVATTEVERAPYRTLFAAANEFRGADCQRYPFVQMAVCGQIKDLYNQLGGVTSWLLWPEEPVSVNPDGRGFRQKFRNGFIYWSPESGALSVNVDSARTWSENGWEAGYLGYPTSEETAVKTTTGIIGVDGTVHGWVQEFQGGRIYRMRGLGLDASCRGHWGDL